MMDYNTHMTFAPGNMDLDSFDMDRSDGTFESPVDVPLDWQGLGDDFSISDTDDILKNFDEAAMYNALGNDDGFMPPKMEPEPQPEPQSFLGRRQYFHEPAPVSLSVPQPTVYARTSTRRSKPTHRGLEIRKNKLPGVVVAPEQVEQLTQKTPRKYRPKPTNEKATPVYQQKRNKNNDAVRKSRAKAKIEKEQMEKNYRLLIDELNRAYRTGAYQDFKHPELYDVIGHH